VRRDLDNGLCAEFTVDPSAATEFVAYVRCRLQVPCGVRVLVRKRRVVLYPRPYRHVAHPERPPTRAVLRAEFRERARADAIIRTIVADAGTFLQRTPCGFDFRAALALFMDMHGSEYGVEIPNVETLEGWISAVERLELLSPYAKGERQGSQATQPAGVNPGRCDASKPVTEGHQPACARRPSHPSPPGPDGGVQPAQRAGVQQ
jgi:hypothetical protein